MYADNRTSSPSFDVQESSAGIELMFHYHYKNFSFLVQSVRTTTGDPSDKDTLVCKRDQTKPEYIPNIYYCNSTQFCCKNAGLDACCSNSFSSDEV